MRKVVFFDRDGTLIIDRIYLNDPNDIEYLPGITPSLKTLRDKGFEFVIVTNQSGLARGIVKINNLKKIHKIIRADLSKKGIDILGFYYAPFLPLTHHYLRKPKPGMLLEAAQDFNINLKKSWMIGDRMTDVEAGHRAGTKTVLIGDLESPESSEFAPPEGHVQSLPEVTQFILNSLKKDEELYEPPTFFVNNSKFVKTKCNSLTNNY